MERRQVRRGAALGQKRAPREGHGGVGGEGEPGLEPGEFVIQLASPAEEDAEAVAQAREAAENEARRGLVERARLRLEDVGANARPARWEWPELAGRLAELSQWRGGPALGWALHLVRDTQRRGEPVAWVGSRRSSFYPPDALALGVDLAALPVVRPKLESEIAVAAEWLARSGAFGLVVADLGLRADVPMALQSRLVAQAQRHDLAVLFLTEKERRSESLSSLVSLRAHATLRRRGQDEFECELEVHKDKRRSRPWRQIEVTRGVAGLR